MMSSLAISMIVFACVLGGALLGMVLRTALPEDHLNADSRSTLNLGIGMISTMAALVLGLLVASAASSYFAQQDELIQISAKIVLLDRLLAHYGPETKAIRQKLRSKVAFMVDQLWPQERASGAPAALNVGGGEVLYDEIQQLAPQNDIQRSIKGAVLGLALEVGKTRWLMFEQEKSPIPVTLLMMVIFWFTIVFASYGLHAPRNPTVIFALFLCALSVSGAILLIVEMYQPFEGLIQISSAPTRSALAQLGK